MQKKAIRPFGSREGLALEFKEAAKALPKNFFETVCSFLNLANLSNNPNKLDPPYLLFPHAEEIAGKWIIKVQVPASSQVHRTSGDVYLRGEEGDYR